MRFFDSIARLLNWHRTPATALELASEGQTAWTIGQSTARNPFEVTLDHGAAHLIAGMEFHATFQTRTPLRILLRHGELLPLGSTLPDDFEPWMGIWFPKPKTFRSIGLDIDEPHFESLVASQAGPVTVAEYLPFLISIRRAIEGRSGGIEDRTLRLKAACEIPKYADYVQAEGGSSKLCDRFFPPTLSLIPGLSSKARAYLQQRGIRTVKTLQHASDGDLLKINGIGKAKLQAMRKFCFQYDGDIEAERVENFVI